MGARSFRPYSELRARVDEHLDVGPPCGFEEVRSADDIRTKNGRAVGLPRVRAVGGEVEDPVGPCAVDDGFDRISVGQVELNYRRVALDFREPPAVGVRPRQESRLVAVVEQPPCDVRADEAGCTRDDDALHVRPPMTRSGCVVPRATRCGGMGF